MRTRLLAVAALAVAAGLAPAGPAAAAACEQGAGVTVVVDFASLGGGVQTDCAPGDPPSGVDALRDSGHEPTRAAQQPGYFVCRIDGKPANDPCQRASPANAYWSYWHAQPGGSWTYSNTGPAERDPAPGTVEGWAFGAGDPPSVAPPRERAAAPSPSPSPKPSPARTTAAPTSAPPAAVGQATSLSQPSTDPSPAASATSPSATPSTSVTPSPTPEPSTTTASARPSVTPGAVVVDRVDDDGSGSLVGVLVALGVVLLLAAGAAFQLRSRRSADPA